MNRFLRDFKVALHYFGWCFLAFCLSFAGYAYEALLDTKNYFMPIILCSISIGLLTKYYKKHSFFHYFIGSVFYNIFFYGIFIRQNIQCLSQKGVGYEHDAIEAVYVFFASVIPLSFLFFLLDKKEQNDDTKGIT